MNKHFEDAQYYLKRAGETAARGIREELDPIRERLNSIVGGEDEAIEAGRLDQLRTDLDDLSKRAEGQTKEAIEDARSRIDEYREKRAAE